MPSSPKAFSVSAKHAALWVNRLATQPGFCFVARPDGSAFVSAWPTHCWRLPQEPAAWIKVTTAIRNAEVRLRSGGKEHDPGNLFRSGLIGVIDYEAGKHTVAGFKPNKRSEGFTDLGWVGLFGWGLNLPAVRDEDAQLWISETDPSLREKLAPMMADDAPPVSETPSFELTRPFQPTQTLSDYKKKVGRILDLINAGDCYQVNFSQVFEGRFGGAPFTAFQALIEEIPVPHAAYVNTGPYQVLSISPERYLRIEGTRVESKPIKGTRPRGKTEQEDAALWQELNTSRKDHAENLMIVDLIRNDLSRFCIPYSVEVPKLFAIESYRNVHQLVSTVTGELKPGVSAVDALLSAFPGGSITGAPKRRAMEIIDELEPHSRGPYCGSVFSLSAEGVLESNIAIRTLQTDASGKIRCWGGGGIVADSDPQEEYEESVTKIQRLMQTLERLSDSGH